MARIRQQHPRNYINSGNIHTDLENIIRYLNAAELGNKTIGELLKVLFDEDGVFRGPVEFRTDNVEGLQYRIGVYRGAEDGWVTLSSVDEMRGPPGIFGGVVEGPFFYNRKDQVISTGVESVAVTEGGSGYLSPPIVSFSAPDDPNGTSPLATAVLTGDAVTSVTVESPGTGYTDPPTVTIAPPLSGVQATGTSTLAALPVDANVVDYGYDQNTADIVVYKNGLLQAESDYTKQVLANTVTLASVLLADKVTIYSIRSQSVTNYRREDTDVAIATFVIPFVHTADESLLVFRNGVLQQEGGDADYIANPNTNTLTFLDPGGLEVSEKITVMTVENQVVQRLAGLMFEDRYTDGNGFIKWSTMAINDDEIPQAKVTSLAPTLAGKANLFVMGTTPINPVTGDLWLDTSSAPNILKFFDGVQWLETSPESSLPTFLVSNANQYVRVNGTGTALEYANIDFSPLVPKTFMGAANGVATLDSSGRVPANQMPEIFATKTISFHSRWLEGADAVPNKTYYAATIWKHRLRIDGIAHRLSAGTCTIQISVDGVAVGSTYSVTTSPASANTPVVLEIDGTTAARRIEIVVTNQSAAQNLEVGIACATISV